VTLARAYRRKGIRERVHIMRGEGGKGIETGYFEAGGGVLAGDL
jgi:hypothetical protein